MTDPVADHEARGVSSLMWRNSLLSLPILAFSTACCWFGYPALQRRFGLEHTAAIELAAAMGAVPTWLLLRSIMRLTNWGNPPATRRARWIMAEKGLALERWWRPWMVSYTILVALLELAWPAAEARTSPADWSLLLLVVLCWPLIMPAAETTATLDERLRAERGDAIRLGYIVVILLGAIAAVAANYWPSFVAHRWPLIIILGVLVPQVRLVMLDWRMIAEDRDDTH